MILDMSTFAQTEHNVTDLFPVGRTFVYDGTNYEVVVSGKPKPRRGECKTDTYVKAIADNGQFREFKISVKQSNAEFLENKISLERAKEIFGDDAQDIIRKSLQSVKKEFLDDYLVCVDRYRRTQEKTIKLGWKFELLRYDGGRRSGVIVLTRDQKLNVYAGTGLSAEKRNCFVGDQIVEDSGIANMYVEINTDDVNLEYVLSHMLTIEEFVNNNSSDLYFACKALNYRSVPDKWDGNRPLAVYVDWVLRENVIYASINMERPLEKKGDEVGNKLKTILKKLHITSDNFADIKLYLAPEIKVYG